MLVLAAGARVTQVRFLPDGRLLVGTWAAGDAELAIWTLPSGPPVRIPLSVRQVWDEPNRVAASPAGDRFYTTFGALRTHDADGRELPDGPSGPASQVIVSPDGQHLITSYQDADGNTCLTEQAAEGRRITHESYYPHPQRKHLVGFLADGDRYVVVGDNQFRVERRAAEPDSDPILVRYPTRYVNQAQVSPDRRHVGLIGYHSFYLYGTAVPGKPRQIKGGQSFGDFRGFAFHPAGRTLAVIHGGPTLVKLYDLDTLTLRAKLNWKVGKLTCVAFSGDGLLAAAGTEGGRVVVWDVDE